MRFLILGSSSSGNCALISTAQTHVLLDAGFSGLKIRRMLEQMHLSVEQIEAVFITHEHLDHTNGILGLSKYPHIKFFANQDTAQAIERRLKRSINWEIFETHDTFWYKDLQIKTLSVPHDAYDPVGYIFKNPCSQNAERILSLAWITDLGHLPLSVKQAVYDVDFLVLESNYDEELLDQDSKRPWSIKQRIRGRHGHLSNDEAHRFLTQSPHAKWKKVKLVHLSRDCNDLNLLKNLFQETPPQNLFELGICDPNGWGIEPWIDLRELG